MAARQAKLVRQAVAALVLVTAFGAGALAAGADRAPGGQAPAVAADPIASSASGQAGGSSG